MHACTRSRAMSVFVCTYVCKYIHAYMHTYMHACIHAYMHACIHTYIDKHSCMHACIHAYMHTCIHAYMHTCMHTCIHTYLHTYKCKGGGNVQEVARGGCEQEEPRRVQFLFSQFFFFTMYNELREEDASKKCRAGYSFF